MGEVVVAINNDNCDLSEHEKKAVLSKIALKLERLGSNACQEDSPSYGEYLGLKRVKRELEKNQFSNLCRCGKRIRLFQLIVNPLTKLCQSCR